jgi:hypothetical protein
MLPRRSPRGWKPLDHLCLNAEPRCNGHRPICPVANETCTSFVFGSAATITANDRLADDYPARRQEPETLMKKYVWASAIGLFVSGSAVAEGPSDFDGSYTGLQRYIDPPDETRSPSGRTNGCSVPSPKPPTLTIQNGVATMPWCHGSCVMTGQLNKSGHLEMRNQDSNDIIIVQLYPKGAYEFGARAQIDGYNCRQVLTWKKK